MIGGSLSAPSVSVVVPTADRGVLLQRSIDSILAQGNYVAEILIVDNGYTDACFVQVDPRIRIIRTAPRIGPGKARNLGVQASSGILVAFLDDDDLWLPRYLEFVLRTFVEKNADAVLGQLMRQEEAGHPVPYKIFPDNIESQRQVFFSNPGFGGQNLTIRRDVFLAFGGFDEGMPASEDRDLAARMLLAGKVLVPQPNAVAVLCDHAGARARHSLVKGNLAFIKKHWRKMRFSELRRAFAVLVKRYLWLALGH